jgi:hypothetical protein
MIGDWEIERHGDRVFLLGPGEREITVEHFDPSKVEAFMKSAKELGIDEGGELFTKTMVRMWAYPLQPSPTHPLLWCGVNSTLCGKHPRDQPPEPHRA